MKLGSLKPAKGATRNSKRVGRGPGSGTGGTSTYGHKGQKARSGDKYRPWFEGGQMPLQRRLPKRGFTNIHATEVESINLKDLVGLGPEVSAPVLLKLGIMRNPKARLKILGMGDLAEAITVRAHAVSEGARRKIEAAGGRVEVIVIPKRPKRYRKSDKSGKVSRKGKKEART